MVNEYIFNRNYAGSVRLDYGHYLWRRTFHNNLLDPSISINGEKLRVADVATGSGTFLLDLAEILPSTCEFEGFDIDLTPSAGSSSRPPNVKFRQYNILENLPEDLVERYDIVNVRLIQVFLAKDDVLAVTERLLKMLKPGGYLQWSEYQIPRASVISPTGEHSSLRSIPDTNPFFRITQTMRSFGSTDLTWSLEMSSMLSSLPNGAVVDEKVILSDAAHVRNLLKQTTNQIQLGPAEILGRMPPDSDAAKQFRQQLDDCCKDVDEGWCFWLPWIRVVVRKEK